MSNAVDRQENRRIGAHGEVYNPHHGKGEYLFAKASFPVMLAFREQRVYIGVVGIEAR